MRRYAHARECTALLLALLLAVPMKTALALESPPESEVMTSANPETPQQEEAVSLEEVTLEAPQDMDEPVTNDETAQDTDSESVTAAAPQDADSEPVADAAPQDTDSEPVTADTPQDTDSEPVTDAAPQVADSEPVTDAAPQVADSEPVTDAAPQDADSEPVTADTPQDADSEPVTADAPQDTDSEPVTADAPQDTDSEPVEDDALQTAYLQDIPLSDFCIEDYSPLDFIFDPYCITEQTKAVLHGGCPYEAGATLFFKNYETEGSYSLSSRSDFLTIRNPYDFPIHLTVSISVTGMPNIEILPKEEFQNGTCPEMYLAFLDTENTLLTLSEKETVSVAVELQALASYSFGLTGTCNPYNNWECAAQDSPKIVISWQWTADDTNDTATAPAPEALDEEPVTETNAEPVTTDDASEVADAEPVLMGTAPKAPDAEPVPTETDAEPVTGIAPEAPDEKSASA